MKKNKFLIFKIFVLFIFVMVNTIVFAKSGIINNINSEKISPIVKELHNWKKISDGKYEVYNMFYDDCDSSGNLIQTNNYYKYIMDKNKISENEKVDLRNNLEKIMDTNDKKVLNERFSDYYKTIYTQANFNSLTKKELNIVVSAFSNAYSMCRNYIVKQDFKLYHTNEVEANYYYLKINYLLAKWILENYDENINKSVKNIKKYDSQLFDILKHYHEYEEDFALKVEVDDYSQYGYYEYDSNIGFHNIKKSSELIDNCYYELDVNTNIRVSFENSMINDLKNGDEIKVYKYKKGIKDEDYNIFIFKGFVKFDDVFWKYDKDDEEYKNNEFANNGYEHYKKFFGDRNITKFAKFESTNGYEFYVDGNNKYDYVAIDENRFSAPLFNIGYIGAQLYSSPFGQYELFFSRNFISNYKVRIMQNALLLDLGGSIYDCINCFAGQSEIYEKLELKDKENAMNDIGKIDINRLISYIYFNDKNYITCLIDIAHSEGDIPSYYGQYNKPLYIDLSVKKNTKVYKESSVNSEVIYTFESDVSSKVNESKYNLSAYNKYVDEANNVWIKISFREWIDRGGWRRQVEEGWVYGLPYEIKEESNEYFEWYPYSQ